MTRKSVPYKVLSFLRRLHPIAHLASEPKRKIDLTENGFLSNLTIVKGTLKLLKGFWLNESIESTECEEINIMTNSNLYGNICDYV